MYGQARHPSRQASSPSIPSGGRPLGALRAALVVALVTGLAACGSDKKAAPAGGAKDGAKPAAPAKKGGGEFVPEKENTEAKAAEAAKSAVFKGGGERLLKPDEVKGFALIQGPEYYTTENIFEPLDGGSEGYLTYGLTEMAKAVYKPSNIAGFEEEVSAEIYSFKDFLGSIGKFSEERSNCLKEETFGENWCLRQSDVIFWKGTYMVKVQTFDDGPKAEEAITKVAKGIDGKLKDIALKKPEPFERFPTEHMIKGTDGWRVRDMFGFDGLKGLYVRLYKPPGEAYASPDASVTLFGDFNEDKEESAKLFESLKTTAGKLAKGGVKPLEGVGEQAFYYTDSVGTHSFFLKDSLIGGGRDFKDEATAKTLTTALAASLAGPQ